ncbi:hypothetical protein J3F84DRAFT_89797 [Trichoderma pleuroticola]
MEAWLYRTGRHLISHLRPKLEGILLRTYRTPYSILHANAWVGKPALISSDRRPKTLQASSVSPGVSRNPACQNLNATITTAEVVAGTYLLFIPASDKATTASGGRYPPSHAATLGRRVQRSPVESPRQGVVPKKRK